jgi:hypothetical protein
MRWKNINLTALGRNTCIWQENSFSNGIPAFQMKYLQTVFNRRHIQYIQSNEEDFMMLTLKMFFKYQSDYKPYRYKYCECWKNYRINI